MLDIASHAQALNGALTNATQVGYTATAFLVLGLQLVFTTHSYAFAVMVSVCFCLAVSKLLKWQGLGRNDVEPRMWSVLCRAFGGLALNQWSLHGLLGAPSGVHATPSTCDEQQDVQPTLSEPNITQACVSGGNDAIPIKPAAKAPFSEHVQELLPVAEPDRYQEVDEQITLDLRAIVDAARASPSSVPLFSTIRPAQRHFLLSVKVQDHQLDDNHAAHLLERYTVTALEQFQPLRQSGYTLADRTAVRGCLHLLMHVKGAFCDQAVQLLHVDVPGSIGSASGKGDDVAGDVTRVMDQLSRLANGSELQGHSWALDCWTGPVALEGVHVDEEGGDGGPAGPRVVLHCSTPIGCSRAVRVVVVQHGRVLADRDQLSMTHAAHGDGRSGGPQLVLEDVRGLTQGLGWLYVLPQKGEVEGAGTAPLAAVPLLAVPAAAARELELYFDGVVAMEMAGRHGTQRGSAELLETYRQHFRPLLVSLGAALTLGADALDAPPNVLQPPRHPLADPPALLIPLLRGGLLECGSLVLGTAAVAGWVWKVGGRSRGGRDAALLAPSAADLRALWDASDAEQSGRGGDGDGAGKASVGVTASIGASSIAAGASAISPASPSPAAALACSSDSALEAKAWQGSAEAGVGGSGAAGECSAPGCSSDWDLQGKAVQGDAPAAAGEWAKPGVTAAPPPPCVNAWTPLIGFPSAGLERRFVLHHNRTACSGPRWTDWLLLLEVSVLAALAVWQAVAGNWRSCMAHAAQAMFLSWPLTLAACRPDLYIFGRHMGFLLVYVATAVNFMTNCSRGRAGWSRLGFGLGAEPGLGAGAVEPCTGRPDLFCSMYCMWTWFMVPIPRNELLPFRHQAVGCILQLVPLTVGARVAGGGRAVLATVGMPIAWLLCRCYWQDLQLRRSFVAHME